MTNVKPDQLLSRTAEGNLKGPHWSLLGRKDANQPGHESDVSLNELLDEVSISPTSLGMRTEIQSSGLNVALQRWPKVETEIIALPKTVGLLPTWKPTRLKVSNFRLQFPECTDILA